MLIYKRQQGAKNFIFLFIRNQFLLILTLKKSLIPGLAFCLPPLFSLSSSNGTRLFFSPSAITVNKIQIWEMYSGCRSIIFSSWKKCDDAESREKLFKNLSVKFWSWLPHGLQLTSIGRGPSKPEQQYYSMLDIIACCLFLFLFSKFPGKKRSFALKVVWRGLLPFWNGIMKVT